MTVLESSGMGFCKAVKSLFWRSPHASPQVEISTHLLGAMKSLTLMMICLQNPLWHGPLGGMSRISKLMELLMISPLCGTTSSSLSPAVLPATAA